MMSVPFRTQVLLAVIVSGVLWFVSTGINHVWVLTWLAPLPLLLVLLDLRPMPAVLAGFIASALGALSWCVAYGGFPIALVLMVAIPFTVAVSIWRAVATRVKPVLAALAYPALIASTEFLFSKISPHGTLGSVSYSQGDVPVVIQLASVTGIWGLSFLVSLPPAAVAIGWRHRRDPKRLAHLLLVCGVPISIALLFGAVRLAASGAGAEVRVGLAASDSEAARQLVSNDPGEALQSLRAYADRASALANQGATIVVLPEKFVRITAQNAGPATAILSAVAQDRHVIVVCGVVCRNAVGAP